MIFINKTTPHSIEAKRKLEAWKNGVDLERLYNEDGQTGKKLWDIGDNEAQNMRDILREDLKKEQAYICCYCCQSLKSINTKIDHFLTKSARDCADKAQAFAERVFNYDNLILACNGGETSQKPYEVKVKKDGQIQSKEDIAELLNVSTALLDELNGENMVYSRGAKIRYTGGRHCDATKEDSILPIFNPTIEDEYWKYFKVNPKDGLISVSPEAEASIEDFAHNTLEILNLNEPRLKDYRKTAWGKFEEILIEQEDFQATFPDPDLLNAFLQEYLEIQLEGDKEAKEKAPFCFVNYHVIQSLIRTPSV